MNICVSVCEYNPLHNGHLEHIRYIKEKIKPDYTVVIMSGNFTQRGDIAVMDKYTRAKHAVFSGCDMVLELPTVFATSNAEIFAKGAIKLLDNIPGNKTLCFGSESGSKSEFLNVAECLNNESAEFKKSIKTDLKAGISLPRAKLNALKKINPNDDTEAFLSTPNNILGIEYSRAILQQNSKIEICPIRRLGAGYSDEKLLVNLSSANAIRTAISNGETKKIKTNVPSYVFSDLPEKLPNCDDITFYSLLSKSRDDLAKILDCTEGLENRIKSLMKDSLSINELIERVGTKRYTNSRIRRIFLHSLLIIEESFIQKCLKNDLYLKVLAISRNSDDLLAKISKSSKATLITRKSDYTKLGGISKQCFDVDIFANDIYNYICKLSLNEYFSLIV